MLYGLDPLISDSDNDGMPDAWEIANGLNPLDAADAISDPDADMLPNIYEWHHNCNPQVADSEQAARLYVDQSGIKSGSYRTIRAALDASSAYSIIELGKGHYFGNDNVGIIFPEHPVLLTSAKLGAERSAVLHATYWGLSVGAGEATAYWQQNINETMEYLSNQQGITNGYQLTSIDLSGFAKVEIGATPDSTECISLSETVDQSGSYPVRIITYTNE